MTQKPNPKAKQAKQAKQANKQGESENDTGQQSVKDVCSAMMKMEVPER